MARRKESATIDVKIRMKEPLRAALEKAAKRRGVSMNAEMVARLELSFSNENYADRMISELGGEEAYKVLMVVGRAMALAGGGAAALSGTKPADWPSSATAYAQARRAAELVLKALRPLGDASPLKGFKGRSIGEHVAESLLVKLGMQDAAAEQDFFARAEEEEA